MSNLDYLEASKDFRSYYRTLLDLNYYFRDNPELGNGQIQIASRAITELIYHFIGVNGTTFREMDQDQYVLVYQMFRPDFLAIIQNSGENDVDFDDFAELIDEILEAANLRLSALERIAGPRQENETENEGTLSDNGEVSALSETDEAPVEDDTEITVNEVVGENLPDERNNSGNDEVNLTEVESTSDAVGALNGNDGQSDEPYQYHDQGSDYKVYRRRRYE